MSYIQNEGGLHPMAFSMKLADPDLVILEIGE